MSKFIFKIDNSGNLTNLTQDGNNLYQGMAGIADYSVKVEREAVFPTDTVLIVFKRPDGKTAPMSLRYEGGGTWRGTSRGWETDVSFQAASADVFVSFEVRRYSSVDNDKYVQILKTGQSVIKLYPSSDYVPLGIADPLADSILERLSDLESNNVDIFAELAEAVNAVTVEQMIDTAKQDIDPKVDEIEGELVYVPKTPDSNQMFDKLKIYGQSKQDGTPTPDNPIEIKSTKSSFDLTANNSNIMTDEIMYNQGFRKYVDAEKGVAWWRSNNNVAYSHIDIDGNSIDQAAYTALSQAERDNYIRYERVSDYRIFTNSYGYKGKVSIKYDYRYDHPNLLGAFIEAVYKDGTSANGNIAFSSTWATISFGTTKEIDYFYFSYATGGSIPYLHNIQIRLGGTATDYISGENETKQIALKDINGNPIVLNGVGDISDYIDLTTGKAHIKLGKSSADITDAVPNSAYLGTKTSGGLANVNGEIVVKSGETIVYQLAEAYEIDVHPDTLAALRTLKSYSGGTALWNDGGAILNLDYLKIDSDPNYVQFVGKDGETLAPYTKGNMVGIGTAGGEVVYLTDDDGRLQQIIDGEVVKFTDFGEGVTVTDNLTSTSTTSALSANQGRALDVKKQDKLTAGNGINIAGGVISSTGELAIVYDVVIRTQAEFEALIASPTWFDVTSVAFVGQFTLSTSNNSGVKRPANVTRIDGYNNAKITVTNFVYNASTARGGLWDDENTNNPRCYITDLTVDCTGGVGYSGYGFSGSNNTYTNCTGTGTGTGTGSDGYGNGFSGSNNTYTNCTGTGTGTSGGAGNGFNGNNNTYTNCTGTGGDDYGNGFSGSNNTYTNCTGTGTGVGYGNGFSGSNNTYTNCTGTGTGTGGYGYGNGFSGSNNTYTNCTGTGDGYGGYGFSGDNNRIISCTALAYILTGSTPDDSNCVPIYNSLTAANLFMIIRDCKFPQIAKSGYQQGTIWCNIANNTTMVGSIKDNVYHSRFIDALIKG